MTVTEKAKAKGGAVPSRFEKPKRIRIVNKSNKPVERCGVWFMPKPDNRARGKDQSRSAPVYTVEVGGWRDELMLRACVALDLEYVEGEPWRATNGPAKPIQEEPAPGVRVLEEIVPEEKPEKSEKEATK